METIKRFHVFDDEKFFRRWKITKQYHMSYPQLKHGQYYHIYNRGNNRELLFRSPDYYRLFLEKYAKYICPVADTLAYCLMSNHFHLVIRIKEEHEILSFSELGLFADNKGGVITDKKPRPSGQLQHLFNSYATTINTAHCRTGSLFEHPFRRKTIEDESYLRNCIAYVHNNPVKDKFVSRTEDYKWSSFVAIASDKPTHVDRDFVLGLFGGRDNFLAYHGKEVEFEVEFDKETSNRLKDI